MPESLPLSIKAIAFTLISICIKLKIGITLIIVQVYFSSLSCLRVSLGSIYCWLISGKMLPSFDDPEAANISQPSWNIETVMILHSIFDIDIAATHPKANSCNANLTLDKRNN